MLLKLHLHLLSIITVILIFSCLEGHGQNNTNSTPEKKSKKNKSGDAGHGFIGFQTGYYYNDDSNDGNPFLDEQLRVIEPVVIYDYNVTDKLSTWGKFSYDDVSSASIDRLADLPGTQQSGASGDFYWGFDTGLRYKLSDSLRVGGFVSGSTEFDYDSMGIGGDIAKDSPDKNTTVKLTFNTFLDQINIIRFNGSEDEGKDERVTFSTTLNWYQIINPKTHSELGFTFTYQEGFLETAYNAVVIEHPLIAPDSSFENNAQGFEIVEKLPETRLRGAIFGRVKHYLKSKTALELYGRLYVDTWDIFSLTAEPSINQWILKDVLSAKIHYRYYIQTKSEYYSDHFFLPDLNQMRSIKSKRFRTQDSDLADFDSHSIGLQLNLYLTDTLIMDMAADYIFRSDGINQTINSLGMTFKF